MSINLNLRLKIFISVPESIDIRSSSSIHQPRDTLESSTCINNLNIKVFARTIMESFVLHKDHVSNF